MSTPRTILQTEIGDLNPNRGKVRDIYDLGDKLLMVATDRISAFDVIMANGITDKGTLLTQISLFWLELLAPVFITRSAERWQWLASQGSPVSG